MYHLNWIVLTCVYVLTFPVTSLVMLVVTKYTTVLTITMPVRCVYISMVSMELRPIHLLCE